MSEFPELTLIMAQLDRIEAKVDALGDRTPPKYLTVKQAAEYLSMNEGNIRTQLSRRQMTCFKMGNRTLIKLSDLEGLMTKYASNEEVTKDYD